MTFVHLMTHTSGLGAGLAHELRKIKTGIDDAPAGFGGPLPGETPAGQHTGGGNFKSRYLEEEMLALAKYPLGFDPGTQWNYHVSTNMLGYLIERISGQPLRQYVKDKVLDPLGMTQTDWYYPRAALSRFVKGYHVADGKLVAGPDIYSEGTVSTEQTYAEGALGLNGPIEDYAKFCQMLLNKGEFNGHRILRPETIELMTTIDRLPAVASGTNGFQFGLGFELYRQKKPVPAVSDSAFAWGGMFGTAYIVDPEKRMIALFYTNTFQPEELYPKYLDEVYRAFAPPAAAAAPTADAPDAPASASTGHVTIVEDGGTGPYPAIATDDRTLPGMTIYRPADLAPFGKAQKLPILLWGNGACANTTQEHKNFLNEIASHGYLVLGIGLLDQIEHRDDTSRQPTNSGQLLAALDWILKQNTSSGSVYEGKVDASRIAAMGMSCGGLQAIEISGDPRVTTTIVCNSGVLPAAPTLKGMPLVPKDALKKFHGPVLYIMGGPTDIAYNNAMDDFSRVDHVPIVMTNFDVGHGGTYGRPHGGEFTPVALAWLDWQLKGSAKGPGMFLGENSELRRDPKWKVETKNFGARK
jgi:CubicO group peptidase (beta-lactamase class C family)/dienelactone hydrolase